MIKCPINFFNLATLENAGRCSSWCSHLLYAACCWLIAIWFTFCYLLYDNVYIFQEFYAFFEEKHDPQVAKVAKVFFKNRRRFDFRILLCSVNYVHICRVRMKNELEIYSKLIFLAYLVYVYSIYSYFIPSHMLIWYYIRFSCLNVTETRNVLRSINRNQFWNHLFLHW